MSALGGILALIGTLAVIGLIFGGFHLLGILEHRAAIRERLREISSRNDAPGDVARLPEGFHRRSSAR